MKTKEKQERLVAILKEWQHIETESIAQTATIMRNTENPVIRMVMEIVQRDSAMHHRIQQFIIDSFERKAIDISPDDLASVWDAIEAHIEAEKKTERLIAESRKALEGTKNVVQVYLLSYLARDEEKHDRLLEELRLIKEGMYKSA